jgi:hypothetical protein
VCEKALIKSAFSIANYQRTTSGVPVPVVGPVVVDARQTAIVTVTTIEPVGVLEICSRPSIICGDLTKSYFP